MHFKSYPILIWWLDDDLIKSAHYMTDPYLAKSINGCFNALISTRLYFCGIRNIKFFNHYFHGDNKAKSMEKYFPLWPSKKIQPTFTSYKSRTSKWCRQCGEHYEYVLTYMSILINELFIRTRKELEMLKVLDWFLVDAPDMKIPNVNLKKITLPWKNLNPKYRRKDIIQGYRLQYISMFDGASDISYLYMQSKLDLPQFILDFYKLEMNY